MQDIKEIKKELNGFTEIELPYKLNPNCLIKYITLKDNNEFFFTGGNFLKMGFDKMILKKDKKIIPVPTVYKDKCGEVLYRTRFFLLEEENECLKDKKELEKVIATQQDIIEKMTLKLEKAFTILQEEREKNIKYEGIIKQLYHK